MSRNDIVRTPDPVVAFGAQSLRADEEESAERSGTAERTQVAAGAGQVPPPAKHPIDSRPVADRFNEPTE